MDQARVTAREKRAEDYAANREQEHRTLLGDARAIVALEWEKLAKQVLASGDTSALTVSELTKLTDNIIKLERLTAGQVTVRKAIDLSSLTDEELEIAEYLADKTKGEN